LVEVFQQLLSYLSVLLFQKVVDRQDLLLIGYVDA
jgi:hypothetical protein